MIYGIAEPWLIRASSNHKTRAFRKMPSLAQIMIWHFSPAPSHCLNQCWIIVNWTLGNNIQWNYNNDKYILILENAFRYIVCKTAAILFRLRCDKCIVNLWVAVYMWTTIWPPTSLHWRHNDHDGVSNHQPHGCLLNRLFGRRSKKTSKLRVIGFVWGIHRDGEFPAHRASYAEHISIWWRHHVKSTRFVLHFVVLSGLLLWEFAP